MPPDHAPAVPDNPGINVGSGGSYVENLYVKRTVTVLAVHEHEVDDISFMNTLSTISFSVASAFAAFGVGILTNAAFAENVTAEAAVAMRLGMPGCFGIAAIFVVLGIIALVRRSRTLKKIRQQSETL